MKDDMCMQESEGAQNFVLGVREVAPYSLMRARQRFVMRCGRHIRARASVLPRADGYRVDYKEKKGKLRLLCSTMRILSIRRWLQDGDLVGKNMGTSWVVLCPAGYAIPHTPQQGPV